MYDVWYRDKQELYERLPDNLKWFKSDPWRSRFPVLDDPRTASYYDRKHIHLLKVAMALSLSYKDELVLSVEDIFRAKTLLDSTEPGMHKALGAAGKNPLSHEILRVASQIASKNEVSYRELLVANFHDIGKKNLDVVLDELRSMGRIKQEGSTWKWTGQMN